MAKLGRFVGVALLLLGACTGDDTPADTEMGSDTQAETETGVDECTPPGVFGDCANGGTAACMAESSQCVQDDPSAPSIGVCGSACDDVCDCWAAPTDGTAPVTCKSLVAGDDGTCVLDCAGGQACPTGMSCSDTVEICVFTVN